MKVKHVILAAIAIIVALVIGFYYVLNNERAQLQEEKEIFTNQQKELMQEELEKLASEYDIQYQKLAGGLGEQKVSLATDSLISQLLAERSNQCPAYQSADQGGLDPTLRAQELRRADRLPPAHQCPATARELGSTC